MSGILLSDALSKRGIKAGRYKVARLMAELGLKVRYPKKFKVTTDSYHNEAIQLLEKDERHHKHDY